MSAHVGWAFFWGVSAVGTVATRDDLMWLLLPIEIGFCAYNVVRSCAGGTET